MGDVFGMLKVMPNDVPADCDDEANWVADDNG
jgi:hypothetical protein